jgi:hypothetical protein
MAVQENLTRQVPLSRSPKTQWSFLNVLSMPKYRPTIQRFGLLLAVADEAHQLPPLGVQLEPQRPPHGQVLLGRSPQRAHAAPPGHGRASTCSAFLSI